MEEERGIEKRNQVHSYSCTFGIKLKEVEEKGLDDAVLLPLSPLMATRTLLRTENRTLVLMCVIT